MSGILNKRQQARNEKTLQDLVYSIPGNNLCADCGARNPAWASWSLGIFLCMRCAAVHRKLGTHISKVKSLSMDSWTNEQVENMKRSGNVLSNKTYNPQGKKPAMPVDADEADSAMERFIRSKYTRPQPTINGAKKYNTGSSDEGPPPPLPPKTGNRFFKSGTLSFRSSKKEQRSPRESAFNSHDFPQQQNHGQKLRSRPSNDFGISVQYDSPEATATKLVQLREMGFTDDKRNTMVLKGVNGNLEKTIEALVRLGEGGGGVASLAPPSSTSAREPLSLSRSLTPQRSMQALNGTSKPSPPAVPSPATSSNNPWDIPAAQPQSSQSTGTLPNRNPFINNTNPFGVPNQQNEFALNQSLQNLSIATSQQTLFPNRTGGVPASQQMPHAFHQQTMTPPVPQSQYFSSPIPNNNQYYSHSTRQPQQSYNPFMQASSTHEPSLPLNTSGFQNQGIYNSNPFLKSPNRIASPTLNQIPEQSQQNVYSSPQSVYGTNPFLAPSQVAQPPQPTQQSWYDSQQLLQPSPQPMYQHQRADTASIMALYKYPQLAPTRMQSQDQITSIPETTQAPLSQPQPQPQAVPQRSTSTPLIGTKNPFGVSASLSSVPPAAPSAMFNREVTNALGSSSARSRESMMLGMEMAWNNGRHSPDAFASLSARTG